MAEREHPSVVELVAGWEQHLPAIAAVSEREGKRVLFTEIGYKSTPDGAVEPWTWPQQQAPSARKVSLETQANAYEAFFRAVWDREWFAGSYVWKWFPPHDRVGGPDHYGFTPAEQAGPAGSPGLVHPLVEKLPLVPARRPVPTLASRTHVDAGVRAW